MSDDAIVSNKEMKKAVKDGLRKVVRDDNIEVTAYFYQDRIYIYDVREITNE